MDKKKEILKIKNKLDKLIKENKETEDKIYKILKEISLDENIFTSFLKPIIEKVRKKILTNTIIEINGGIMPKKLKAAKIKQRPGFKEKVNQNEEQNKELQSLINAKKIEDIKSISELKYLNYVKQTAIKKERYMDLLNEKSKQELQINNLQCELTELIENLISDNVVENIYNNIKDKLIKETIQKIENYFLTDDDISVGDFINNDPWHNWNYESEKITLTKDTIEDFFDYIFGFLGSIEEYLHWIVDSGSFDFDSYLYNPILNKLLDDFYITDIYTEIKEVEFCIDDLVLDKIIDSCISLDFTENLTFYFDKEKIIELLKQNHNYKKIIEEYEREETEIPEKLLTEIPKDYPDLYPLARKINRHFILHIGPTNSGKTYNAMESLKESNTGAYFGPLRLLAFEKFEELNNSGHTCSLKTGEEQIIISDSNYTSSTIEMVDFNKKYDCVVIDEAQMISDKYRGGSWTAAILGIQSKKINICLAPEATDIIIRLINECNDSYEIINHERKNELIFENESFIFPNSVKEGDALIVFSKKEVHAVASELQNKGIKCSVIYGVLPYDVRQNEARKFNTKETKVLVATDAIGMGLNLPIKRVIFLKSEKFDGMQVRNLTISEIKQIAGRAGRYGIFEKGYFYLCGDKKLRKLAKENINIKEPQIKKAIISFPKSILNIEASVSSILSKWKDMDVNCGYEKQDIETQILLAKELEKKTDDKDLIYNFISFGIDYLDENLKNIWNKMFECELDNNKYEFPENIISEVREYELNELEELFKICDLLYQYYDKFNYNIEIEKVLEIKHIISSKIISILEKQKLKGKTCKYCSRKLPWNYPYSMCEHCHNEMYGQWNFDDDWV